MKLKVAKSAQLIVLKKESEKLGFFLDDFNSFFVLICECDWKIIIESDAKKLCELFQIRKKNNAKFILQGSAPFFFLFNFVILFVTTTSI